MAIDPEVIPPHSSMGRKAVKPLPRWLIFAGGGLGVLFVVHLLKNLLPLLGMGLLLAFIFNQAKKAA